jgi:hypothetical protein
MMPNLSHMDGMAWLDLTLCLVGAAMLAVHGFCRLTTLCARDMPQLTRAECVWLDGMGFMLFASFVFVAARLFFNSYLFPVDASEVGVNLFLVILLLLHGGDMAKIFPVNAGKLQRLLFTTIGGVWLFVMLLY